MMKNRQVILFSKIDAIVIMVALTLVLAMFVPSVAARGGAGARAERGGARAGRGGRRFIPPTKNGSVHASSASSHSSYASNDLLMIIIQFLVEWILT